MSAELSASKSRKAAHCKVPRYIRFPPGFSVTVMGEIRQFTIRDKMKCQLGLEEDKTA